MDIFGELWERTVGICSAIAYSSVAYAFSIAVAKSDALTNVRAESCADIAYLVAKSGVSKRIRFVVFHRAELG